MEEKATLRGNSFSFLRLKRTLMHDLGENRKRYLRHFLSLSVAWIIMSTLYMLTFSSQFDHYEGAAAYLAFGWQMDGAVRPLCMLIMTCYMMLCGSRIFHFFRDKSKRINYLMFPASLLEKYVSRLIIVFVLALVSFVVSFVMVDVLRVLLQLVTGICPEMAYMCTPHVLAPLFTVDMAWLRAVVVLFWLYTLYVLGGCFWYRNAVLYVSVSIWVVSVVLSWGRFSFMSYLVEDEIIVLLVPLSVIQLVAGYYLFKRVTLLPRKLFSL